MNKTFSLTIFLLLAGVLIEHPLYAINNAAQVDQTGLALKFRDHEESDKQEYERMRSLDKICGDWSAVHKNAFAKLRQAAEVFAQASSRNETDQAGTGRVTFMDEAHAEIENNFVQDIKRSESGEFPNYTQAEFTELDEKLSQVYRAIMSPSSGDKKQPEIFTGITRDGIKEAQRAWLKYRDAWVVFARARYPAVPALAWKAKLTERRIKQLEELE